MTRWLRGALLVTTCAVAVGAWTTVASAKCFGRHASMTVRVPKVAKAVVRVRGTPGDDVIVVRGGSRVAVSGGGGDDRICAPALGAIRVAGGGGNDRISGHVAIVNGGGGNDLLLVRPDDRIRGGPGNDRIVVPRGPWPPVVVDGGTGNDSIQSDTDGLTLQGGPGNDTLHDLGASTTTFIPGPGDDHVIDDPDQAPDVASDKLDYSAARGPVQVDLLAGKASGEGTDTIVGTIERVVGSPAPGDTIIGNDAANVIDMRSGGPDTVFGRGGDDTIFGSGQLHGDAGSDTILGGSGNDLLDGGPDPDYCQGNGGADTFSACETIR